MIIASLFAAVILFMLLVAIASVRIEPSSISIAELRRRREKGDVSVKEAIVRHRYLADLISLQQLLVNSLLVVLVLFLIWSYGWLGGIIGAVVIVFFAVISNQRWLHALFQPLYVRCEPALIRFIKKMQPVFSLIRSAPEDTSDTFRRFDSPEELAGLIAQSADVLSDKQKQLLSSGLGFFDLQVRDGMTPRKNIVSVGKSEVLGPLVLDDLHKSGHSRIPVVARDIDHVVGVLLLRDLLIIDGDDRPRTVEKAMNSHVVHIRDTQPMHDALAVFLQTDAYIAIVTNGSDKTVGLITLGDIITALLGAVPIDTAE